MTNEEVKKALTELKKLFEANEVESKHLHAEGLEIHEKKKKLETQHLELLLKKGEIQFKCHHRLKKTDMGYECENCGKYKLFEGSELEKANKDRMKAIRESYAKRLKVQNKTHKEEIKQFLALVPNQEGVTGLDRSIVVLNLSIRALGGMVELNIKTLDDLVKLTREDILSIKNLGMGTVKEVEQQLAQEGLKLSESNK